MTIRTPFVRSPYNYSMEDASDESGLLCADPSLAVQDQRDEVDINTIVRRFGLTGKLPEDVRMPEYGDFVGISNYHQAMNAVASANESFDALPAEVRSRFGNDPGRFVDFCMDPANLEEARKLGLAAPLPPQADPGEALGTPEQAEPKDRKKARGARSDALEEGSSSE